MKSYITNGIRGNGTKTPVMIFYDATGKEKISL
jgi:hypothetical protein